MEGLVRQEHGTQRGMTESRQGGTSSHLCTLRQEQRKWVRAPASWRGVSVFSPIASSPLHCHFHYLTSISSATSGVHHLWSSFLSLHAFFFFLGYFSHDSCFLPWKIFHYWPLSSDTGSFLQTSKCPIVVLMMLFTAHQFSKIYFKSLVLFQISKNYSIIQIIWLIFPIEKKKFSFTKQTNQKIMLRLSKQFTIRISFEEKNPQYS